MELERNREIIKNEKLEGTFANLDNVTVYGHDKKDHNKNLGRFMDAINQYKLTLNKDKCSFGLNRINLLGYTVSKGLMAPDPERLKPLLELPVPGNIRALLRAMGMFAHYLQWISSFSEKIRPLTQVSTFPLPHLAVKAFEKLKQNIAESAITALDPSIPLVVETDASDCAIAASLRQADRPVAFFSRTLSQ